MINRQCSSGLEAITVIASKIRSGVIKMGIACGVESMSKYEMSDWVDEKKIGEEFWNNNDAKKCLYP